MADAPAAAPAGGARRGGFANSKIGGLPAPLVLAVGVVLIGGVWYIRKKNAAAAAATSAQTAATTTAGVAATPYGPAGGQGIDSSTLAAILASQGQGNTTTAANYTPPTGETLTGAGYAPANPGTPVTSAGGSTFQELGNWQAAQSLISAGQTVYYQPTPGVFAPAAQNGALVIPPGTNTPLYVSQAQSA